MIRLAFVVLLLGLLTACGGSETVATVGDEKISEEEVEHVLEHFDEEFKREGREFPEEGTSAHHELEKSVLGLLVFRAQLEQAARKLGVEVDEDEVEERVKSSEEAEQEGEEESGEAYFENAVTIQLLREKAAAKLGGGLDALEEWVAEARKTPVDYEEGWEP
jgi:hypothetical protein